MIRYSLRLTFLPRKSLALVAWALSYLFLLSVVAGAPPTQSKVQVESRKRKIASKVKQIIVQQLGVDPKEVTPEARFVEDLGVDSLDLVELILAYEEAFNISISDDDAEKIKTVKDAITYMQMHASPDWPAKKGPS